jgi:cellulose synthase/poly-beta-1,6-N-acetylglucosamine synthase-like glycosyltransferase
MGTGMAFPWAVISSAAFASGHIVEDLKLGIDLARAGTPPLFCPEARVTSYFPGTAEGIAGQRTRWEHGHLGMLLSAAPRLFLEALRQRNRDLLVLSLDLSVPPLALLMLLALTVFIGSAMFGVFSTRALPLWLASISLVMLVLSVLLSWARYGRQVISFADLAYTPFYALWKIPLYAKFLERLRGQAIIDWKNDEIKKAYEVGLKQEEAETPQP